MSKPKRLKGRMMTGAELDVMFPPVAFRDVNGNSVVVRPWMIRGVERGPNGGLCLLTTSKKKLDYELDVSMEELLRLASGEPVEH